MKLSIVKEVKWCWYHFVVFWLPGGMFMVSGLIALQMRKREPNEVAF